MSYDLYFVSRSGSRPINRDTFCEYFRGRPHYQVNESQAWYSNAQTGVYFAFDLADNNATDDEAGPSDATFNLNFYRPHIFGLEAEPEVAAFVDAFNPVITDTQLDGMGEGVYSRESFLGGWNRGNEFGYQVFAERQVVPQLLPSSQIETYWKWNFKLKAMQVEVGDNVFVPEIHFLVYEQRAVSIAVWADAMPTLLPQVDFVVIWRDKLAPRRWFSHKPDSCLTPWANLSPRVATFPDVGQGLQGRRIDYTSAPSELISWIRGLSPNTKKGEGITVDKILNEELWNRAQERVRIGQP